MAGWLTEQELLEQVGIEQAELRWLEEQFREQIRFLQRREGEGPLLYAPDAVALLRGLSTMTSQGATPEQIKGWFGLAATRQEKG
ncbi:MAG: hypothetical protein ACOY93_02345 [Bacillota bacterium]